MSIESLQAFSDQLADVVAKISLSTVRVEARSRVAAAGIVWSQEGIILTADHVVEREENIRVDLQGESHQAELVGRDPTSDLAVLRIKAGQVVPATIAGLGNLRVGNMVVAVARPWGEPIASIGYVAALGRRGLEQEWGEQFREGLIHADLTLYPGFSGGPLADLTGQVVGVNTSGPGQRMRVAIPAETAARVASELLKEGRIKRGYLGIGVQKIPLAPAMADKLGIAQETGLMVLTVEPGSGAEAAGILPGDIVVALDDQPIARVRELHAWLSQARSGRQVQARLIRGGEIKQIPVTIGER
ncbi:MAG: S1C family serine protease [Rudaea sp.]